MEHNIIFPFFSPSQEQGVEMELLNVEVDEWEIAVDRVRLQEVIGRGAFGAVWRALLSSPDGKPGNRTVAAKCFTRKILSVCSIFAYLTQSNIKVIMILFPQVIMIRSECSLAKVTHTACASYSHPVGEKL